MEENSQRKCTGCHRRYPEEVFVGAHGRLCVQCAYCRKKATDLYKKRKQRDPSSDDESRRSRSRSVSSSSSSRSSRSSPSPARQLPRTHVHSGKGTNVTIRISPNPTNSSCLNEAKRRRLSSSDHANPSHTPESSQSTEGETSKASQKANTSKLRDRFEALTSIIRQSRPSSSLASDRSTNDSQITSVNEKEICKSEKASEHSSDGAELSKLVQDVASGRDKIIRLQEVVNELRDKVRDVEEGNKVVSDKLVQTEEENLTLKNQLETMLSHIEEAKAATQKLEDRMSQAEEEVKQAQTELNRIRGQRSERRASVEAGQTKVTKAFPWLSREIIEAIYKNKFLVEQLPRLQDPESRAVVAPNASQNAFVHQVPNMITLARCWNVYVTVKTAQPEFSGDEGMLIALLSHLEHLYELHATYEYESIVRYHMAVCRKRFSRATTAQEWCDHDKDAMCKYLMPGMSATTTFSTAPASGTSSGSRASASNVANGSTSACSGRPTPTAATAPSPNRATGINSPLAGRTNSSHPLSDTTTVATSSNANRSSEEIYREHLVAKARAMLPGPNGRRPNPPW